MTTQTHLFSGPAMALHKTSRDLNASVHLLIQLAVPKQLAAMDQQWGGWGRVVPERN